MKTTDPGPSPDPRHQAYTACQGLGQEPCRRAAGTVLSGVPVGTHRVTGSSSSDLATKFFSVFQTDGFP